MNLVRMILIGLLIHLSGVVIAQPKIEEIGNSRSNSKIRRDMELSGAMTLVNALGKNPTHRLFAFTSPDSPTLYEAITYQDKPVSISAYRNYLDYDQGYIVSKSQNDLKIFTDTIVRMDNALYLLFRERYEEEDQYIVYAAEVDDQMKFVGSPLALQTYRRLEELKDQMMYHVSPDGKKLAVLRVPQTKGEADKKINASVYNENLKPSWSSDYNLKRNSEDAGISNIQVDDEGNLLITAKINEDDFYKSAIISYHAQDQNWKMDFVGPETGHSRAVRLFRNRAGEYYMVGYNVMGNDRKYFVDKYDISEQEVTHLSAEPLMESFNANLRTQQLAESKYWEVSKIVETASGNLVFSLEYVGGQNGRLYKLKNTYLVSVDPEGKQNWMHTIYKDVSVLPGAEGNLLLTKEDKVFVIYNDHKGNLKKAPDVDYVSSFNGKNAVITVQEIDAEGKAVKYPFSTDKSLEKHMINSRLFLPLASDKYYVAVMSVSGLTNVEGRNVIFTLE